MVNTSLEPGKQQAKAKNFRLSVRLSLIIAGLGLLTFLPFYILEYHLQSEGASAAEHFMSSMHMENITVYWAFPVLQASGFAALIWSYIGIILGLAVSSRSSYLFPIQKAEVTRLHRQISLLVIGLTLIHVVATAFDAMGDNFIKAMIPWQASFGMLGYNVGIFALYLAIILGPTYYLRKKFNSRLWLIAHRFTLLIYILALWHTLLFEADTAYYSWLRPFIWIMQIPLLLLFMRTLLILSASAKKPPNASGMLAKSIRYGLVLLRRIDGLHLTQ